MADENKDAVAQRTYDALCEYCDGKGYSYDKNENEDEKWINISFTDDEGNNLRFVFTVDFSRNLIRVLNFLPISVEEDKKTDFAVGINEINEKLRIGWFDFGYEQGNITYNLCNSFSQSMLGEEFFEYLFEYSLNVNGYFLDRFIGLNSGMFSLEDWLD